MQESFFTFCNFKGYITFRLTGKFVFSGKGYREILSKNKECNVPFPSQYWNQLTLQAKDLV